MSREDEVMEYKIIEEATSIILSAELRFDTLGCLYVPLESIEATDASGEQRIVLDFPLLSLGLPWVSDLINYLVVVPVDFLDLCASRLQSLLGLEVSTIGQDRPNLRPPLRLKLLHDRASDVRVIEQIKLLTRPVQDVI